MNLKTYILDHAESYINRLKPEFDETNPKNQHFTLSIDISQLIINKRVKSQEDIDKIISDFMHDLANHSHTFTESKGRRNGKQIFREIEFHLRDALVAYHNTASDNINSQNYEVYPHLHILCDKSKKLGIGYYQLRKAINEVSQRHGLVFSLEEESKEKDNSLKRACTSFSWFVKKSTDSDFVKRVAGDQFKKDLENIKKNYENTGNLQYYIKTMRDLRARLNKEQIDFTWKGKNLRKEFPLFLTDNQIADIKILHKGENKKEIYRIMSERDNPIGRAFIEHNQGFKNIITNELEERGVTFHKIAELDFSRIDLKVERKEKKTGDFQKSINFCYKEDFLKAVSLSKNEKEVQELMQNMGYANFKYKQKTINSKRQKVGFTFTNKNQKSVTVYFSNLKIDLKDIRATLKANNALKEEFERENVYSHLKNYKPKKAKKEDLKKEHFEEIYKFLPQHDVSKYYISETFESVKMYKKGAFIEDQGNKLVTRSNTKNMDESIAIMIDIAKAKGWEYENIEIQGSKEFKEKVLQEIELRKQQQKEEEEIKYTEKIAAELKEEAQEEKSQDQEPSVSNVSSGLSEEIRKESEEYEKTTRHKGVEL